MRALRALMRGAARALELSPRRRLRAPQEPAHDLPEPPQGVRVQWPSGEQTPPIEMRYEGVNEAGMRVWVPVDPEFVIGTHDWVRVTVEELPARTTVRFPVDEPDPDAEEL